MASRHSGVEIYRRGMLLGVAAAAANRPVLAAPAAHAPAQIWLIRHAEKPEGSGNPHLSPRGNQRAVAIGQAFPARFKPITAMFAAQPVGASYRPFETVLPLYNALAAATDQPPPFTAAIPDAQYQHLAAQILGDATLAGGNVLICWHHGKLPDLARALAAGRSVVDGAGRAKSADGKAYRIPKRWDEAASFAAEDAGGESAVYDRVWQLSFTGDDTVAFVDLPQELLPGDSTDTRGPAT